MSSKLEPKKKNKKKNVNAQFPNVLMSYVVTVDTDGVYVEIFALAVEAIILQNARFC
jgi:hypothetical protein